MYKSLLIALLLAGCISLGMPSPYTASELSTDFTQASELRLNADAFADSDNLLIEVISGTSQQLSVSYSFNFVTVQGEQTPAGSEPNSPTVCTYIEARNLGGFRLGTYLFPGAQANVAGQSVSLQPGAESAGMQDADTTSFQLTANQPTLIRAALDEAAYWANDGQSTWQLQVKGADFYYRILDAGMIDCGLRPIDFDAGTYSDTGVGVVAQDLLHSTEFTGRGFATVIIASDQTFRAEFSGPMGTIKEFQKGINANWEGTAWMQYTEAGTYEWRVSELRGSSAAAGPTFAGFFYLDLPVNVDELTP